MLLTHFHQESLANRREELIKHAARRIVAESMSDNRGNDDEHTHDKLVAFLEVGFVLWFLQICKSLILELVEVGAVKIIFQLIYGVVALFLFWEDKILNSILEQGEIIYPLLLVKSSLSPVLFPQTSCCVFLLIMISTTIMGQIVGNYHHMRLATRIISHYDSDCEWL